MKKIAMYILQDLAFEQKARAMGFDEKEIEAILSEAKRLKRDEKEPVCCPICASGNILAEEAQHEAGMMWRNVGCEDCDHKWAEYYNFYDWESV